MSNYNVHVHVGDIQINYNYTHILVTILFSSAKCILVVISVFHSLINYISINLIFIILVKSSFVNKCVTSTFSHIHKYMYMYMEYTL